MEEMQRLIGRRAGGEPSRPRPLSMATESSLPRLVEYTRAEEVARSMDEDASHVDADLLKAVQHLEVVHGDLEKLTSTLTEVSEITVHSHPRAYRDDPALHAESEKRRAGEDQERSLKLQAPVCIPQAAV